MEKIWEIYPGLTEVVRKDHEAYGMDVTGHPLDHTLQVAQVALLIAEDSYTGRIAGAAGLCHNADRLIQKERGVGKKDIPDDDVSAMVQGWLDASEEGFETGEILRIVSAVLLHSNVNQENSDTVLVDLQDSDRIVCSMADNVMTAAQFWRELPAIDPRCLTDGADHPYKNPGSVLKNLVCRFDWIDPTSKVCVRLPKAKALMERRANFIRNYIAEIEEQRAEIGLWPRYPF